MADDNIIAKKMDGLFSKIDTEMNSVKDLLNEIYGLDDVTGKSDGCRKTAIAILNQVKGYVGDAITTLEEWEQ